MVWFPESLHAARRGELAKYIVTVDSTSRAAEEDPHARKLRAGGGVRTILLTRACACSSCFFCFSTLVFFTCSISDGYQLSCVFFMTLRLFLGILGGLLW